MRQRTRKLIGAIFIAFFVLFYAFMAMVLGHAILVDTGRLAQFAYYIVAGLFWIFPTGLVIWWMEKPDQPKH